MFAFFTPESLKAQTNHKIIIYNQFAPLNRTTDFPLSNPPFYKAGLEKRKERVRRCPALFPEAGPRIPSLEFRGS